MVTRDRRDLWVPVELFVKVATSTSLGFVASKQLHVSR